MSAALEVRPTELPEVLLITPRVFTDARGFVFEAFSERSFSAAGLAMRFVQDNHCRSPRGVVRGLHYQLASPQGKLVRAARGRIFDVAADVRRGSPTFGKWVGVELDDRSGQQLWIPKGFAHGFCALSDEADVVYKCTDFYAPSGERGVIWDDPTLAIDWPVSDPLLSEKDARLPRLAEAGQELPLFSAPR